MRLLSFLIPKIITSTNLSNYAIKTISLQFSVNNAAFYALRLYQFSLFLGLFLLRLMGVLDRQAPDIQIIADCPYDVNNKATVHTYSETQAHEDECDLVNIIAESARPANANVLLQPRSH